MANSKTVVLLAAAIYPPDPGGPALHAKKYFEEFPKRGIETRLVVLSHLKRWPKGVRHMMYFSKLFVKAFGTHVIYAHDAVGAGIPALVVARILRRKIVVRIGGDVAWERKADHNATTLSLREWYAAGEHRGNRLFTLSRFFLTRVDLMIVTSPLLKNLYVDYYGVRPERIHVVVNPVPNAPTLDCVTSENTIIFASRLVGYKNVSFVLRVLKNIFSKHQETKFIIMGDGPERRSLEELARKLQIEKQVVFTGSVSQQEVIEQTASSRFALAPALTEFNPNYILQAIAFKKPFLLSKEEGFDFHIPHEFLFDPRNASELESKINWLLVDEGYKEAEEKVRKLTFHWSWDDVINSNIQFIKSL